MSPRGQGRGVGKEEDSAKKRTWQNNRTWQRDRYQATSPVGVASQDHLYAVPGKQPCYYGFTPAMAKFEIPARARPSGYLDRA
jgi:hypothetical protein